MCLRSSSSALSILPMHLNVLESLLQKDRLTALDVGARLGLHPRFQKFLKLLQVDAIEPDPAECDRLQANADPRVTYYPEALAQRSGPASFYQLQTRSGSSLYPPSQPVPAPFRPPPSYWTVDQVVQTQCLSFSDFRRKHGTAPPVLVKLDTQGSELDILRGFSAEDWADVLCIETEVEFTELYCGQPLFHDLHPFLAERGFGLIGLTRHPTFFGRNGNKYHYLGGELQLFKDQFGRIASPFVSGDAVYFRLPFEADPFRDRKRFLRFVVCSIIYDHLDLALWLCDDSRAGALLATDDLARLRTCVRRHSPRSGPAELFMRKLARRGRDCSRRWLTRRVAGASGTSAQIGSIP